jgi:SAM-dependent methyltransferase
MYKKIDWPIADDYKGERELEVAWVRQQLSGIKNKVVADFGGINYGSYGGQSRWIGLEKYGLDPSNKTLVFDRADFEGLRGKYIKADLMTPGFYRADSVDVGVCVSVLEHIGINCEPKVLSGDLIALRNIYNVLRVGGVLLLTVPVTHGAMRTCREIRVYNPDALRAYVAALFGGTAEYEYYRYVPPFWMKATDEKSLEEMELAPIDQTKRRGVACLACLKITRKV